MKLFSKTLIAGFALSGGLMGLTLAPTTIQAGVRYYHFHNVHYIDGRRYVHNYTVTHRTGSAGVRHYYYHHTYRYHYR